MNNWYVGLIHSEEHEIFRPQVLSIGGKLYDWASFASVAMSFTRPVMSWATFVASTLRLWNHLMDSHSRKDRHTVSELCWVGRPLLGPTAGL